MLVYIRNPLSQFRSVYHQAIKRTKFTGTIDEFVTAPGFNWRDYAKAEDFVHHCEVSGVDVEVLNYSETRANLFPDVLRWLGVPAGAVPAPDIVVNRGLSFSELEVMRVLRRIFGHKSAFRTSDKLVNTMRDVAKVELYPSRAVLEALLFEIAPVTDQFDARFGERYCRFNFEPGAELAAFEDNRQPAQLSTEYLDALTEMLGRDVYIDGLSTAELARAFFGRIRDRMLGR